MNKHMILQKPENMDWSPVPSISMTQQYITYCVPYYFIRRFFPDFTAAPGKTMRANFYKCGDLTVEEHHFAWNPIVGEDMSFHRTCL